MTTTETITNNNGGNGEQLLRNEHTHFAKITENAKGEPSVTVSIYGDDEYAVHDQVMGLYAMLKKSLAGGIKTE
jgi:hypothetical protein